MSLRGAQGAAPVLLVEGQRSAAAGCGGSAVPAAPVAQQGPAPSASPSENSWQLIHTGSSQAGSSADTPTLAARPQRRPTAAPATAVAQPGADPLLVRLTQQLIACSGSPADMQAALAAAQLDTAGARRLLTYLDRQGAGGVAVAALHAMEALGHPGAGAGRA